MLKNGYAVVEFAKHYGKDSIKGQICSGSVYSYKDACERKKVVSSYLTPHAKAMGRRYLIVKVVDSYYN